MVADDDMDLMDDASRHRGPIEHSRCILRSQNGKISRCHHPTMV